MNAFSPKFKDLPLDWQADLPGMVLARLAQNNVQPQPLFFHLISILQGGEKLKTKWITLKLSNLFNEMSVNCPDRPDDVSGGLTKEVENMLDFFAGSDFPIGLFLSNFYGMKEEDFIKLSHGFGENKRSVRR